MKTNAKDHSKAVPASSTSAKPPASHPPSQPHWLPAGVEYEQLPKNLRRAIRDVIEPTYQELVLEAKSGLARSTGLTIVHLLWLEVLDQLELDVPTGVVSSFDLLHDLSSGSRQALIERHLRLVHAKLKASDLLCRLHAYAGAIGATATEGRRAARPVGSPRRVRHLATQNPRGRVMGVPEKCDSVDQKWAAARKLIESSPHDFARQGAVVATWRTGGDQRRGPYYVLRYRDGPRQRSLYLGSSASLADRVRQLLYELQRPRLEQRELDRIRSAVKRSLRRHKAGLNEALQQHFGWRLHGFEAPPTEIRPVNRKAQRSSNSLPLPGPLTW